MPHWSVAHCAWLRFSAVLGCLVRLRLITVRCSLRQSDMYAVTDAEGEPVRWYVVGKGGAGSSASADSGNSGSTDTDSANGNSGVKGFSYPRFRRHPAMESQRHLLSLTVRNVEEQTRLPARLD